MSNMQSNGGQASRHNDKIIVHLSQQQPVPDMIPYELREHIYPDEWQWRLNVIKDTAFRYYKPRLERIWYIITIISVIILPLAIYRVILNALDDDGPQAEQHFFRARSIAFAVFLALLVILWAPILIWKWIPSRKIQALLRGWAKTDNMNKQHKGFIPIWSVSQPSVFRSTCIVTVTIPPNVHPTVFHPLAYAPPFINAPPNAGPMYYNSHGQPQVPYMNAAGDAPPYDVITKEKMLENVNL